MVDLLGQRVKHLYKIGFEAGTYKESVTSTGRKQWCSIHILQVLEKYIYSPASSVDSFAVLETVIASTAAVNERPALTSWHQLGSGQNLKVKPMFRLFSRKKRKETEPYSASICTSKDVLFKIVREKSRGSCIFRRQKTMWACKPGVNRPVGKRKDGTGR